MKRLALLVAVFLAVVPSSAHAARVVVDRDLGELFYGAGTGEVNDLRVSYSPGTWTIADLGAVINAGDGCSSGSIHEVTCSFSGVASFELGDLNDTVEVFSASPEVGVALSGNAGSDELRLCSTCDGIVHGGGGHPARRQCP
jgi:hypothetical protein